MPKVIQYFSKVAKFHPIWSHWLKSNIQCQISAKTISFSNLFPPPSRPFLSLKIFGMSSTSSASFNTSFEVQPMPKGVHTYLLQPMRTDIGKCLKQLWCKQWRRRSTLFHRYLVNVVNVLSKCTYTLVMYLGTYEIPK